MGVIELKNPFGIVNNKLKHISEIQKGEEIYCPECRDRLILRDGNKMIKHLSHKTNTSNDCSNESIIHKYTKQYLYQQLNKISISKHKIEIKNGKFILSDYECLNIISKYMEYRGVSDNYIPDIFLILEGKYKIAIEICYKNPKDKQVINKLIPKLNIDQVIEIKVEEKDLIEFNIEEILKRGIVIYNKLEDGFTNAENKVIKLKEKYNNLKEENEILKKKVIKYITNSSSIINKQDLHHFKKNGYKR